MRALLLLAGLISFPLWAAAEPPAPQTVVIISCRVDDLTGQPGRQDPDLAAKGWRDLEWHLNGNELECKREQIDLVDQVALMAPETPELHPNFSNHAQCVAVAMQVSPTYEREHRGWAVMAVGCPVKIVNEQGQVVGWHLPECPSAVGGLPIKCRFDGSLI